MLFIFRKLRKSFFLPGKAKTYLAYAVGEIALIVVGILIAVQIGDWNEQQKDRIREKNVLIDLESSLERNITLARDAISEVEKINLSSSLAIQSIEERLPYSDTLAYHFNQMTRSGSYLYQINRDGYESFKNIGFEIIRPKALRNEIIALFEVSYTVYEREIEVTNAMWGSIPFWWKEYFITDLDGEMTPISYDKLREENDVLNIVKTLLKRRIDLIETLKTVISETQNVLESVQGELERVHQ